MKTVNAFAALAAATSVYAAPSSTEQLLPRASTLPAITVKGNGMLSIHAMIHQPLTNTFQPSSQEAADSTSVVLIINQEDLRSSWIPWLILQRARVTSPSSRSWG